MHQSSANKLPGFPVRWIVLPVALVIVAVGLWFFLSHKGGPILGYAGSVVRYADRNYESSAWVERREAAAISSMVTTEKGVRLGKLAVVTGLDRDNLWVVDKVGNLFRLKDGHWSYNGPIARGMVVVTARATADGGVVVGGMPRKGQGLAIWRDTGLQTFDTARSGVLADGHIHVLADDYINYFTIAGAGNAGTNAYQVVSGRMEQIQPQKNRAFFVQTSDNVPDKDLILPYIRATATFKPLTEAYGFWQFRDKGAVLRFQNGTWYVIDKLSRGVAEVRSIWFGEDADGKFMIAAGLGGLVLSHPFGGATVDQSVNTNMQVPTSAALIAAWGIDRNTFWVMDSSGTVWRRSDNIWQMVIRGLYDRDVIFRDAYVDPIGVVTAITDNSIYVLD